ncbi:unnamed protein product, partial [marine sediment metagenome]
ANGMPLGAVIGKKNIMDKYDKACPESTRAGNEISCAASLAALNVIEKEQLLKQTMKIGNHMIKRLHEMSEEHEIIGDIRGKGLLIGVELVKDRISKKPDIEKIIELRTRVRKKGLILSSCGTYRQVIKIAPPLIISEEEADVGLNIFEDTIKEIE